MAFFEELGKKITKSGQDAAQKAKNMAETVKLNGFISDEERRIKNAFTQIGEQYYQTLGENPDPGFSPLIADINDAKAKISAYAEQIKQIKGVTNCENCGAEVSLTAPFCSGCGTAIQQAAKPEERSCTNCGKPLEPNQVFCGGCGTRAEQQAEPSPEITEEAPSVVVTCANCNHEIVENAAFCLNCGAKVDA